VRAGFRQNSVASGLAYFDALWRLRDAEPDRAILITESNPALLKPLVDAAYAIERGEVRTTTL
jgi:branched-chain amino acid transport system ATP-binding protein